jgi:hypothetical protein
MVQTMIRPEAEGDHCQRRRIELRRLVGLGAGGYVKKPYIREKIGLAIRKELDRS